MHRLINLLSDINFWSILGVIITIVTLIVTIEQRQDIDVVFSLHAKSDLAIEDCDKITFVLLAADNFVGSVKKIKIPAPMGFYNPNKNAIDIEYTVKTKDMGCSLNFNEFKSVRILRNYGKLLDFYFECEAEQLFKNKWIKSNAIVMWSYENMSDRSNAKFDIECLIGAEQYNSFAEDSYVVVFIPDLENSSKEELSYKILTEKHIKHVLNSPSL